MKFHTALRMKVYAMINEGNPSIIKIGMSANPIARAKQLNKQEYGLSMGCSEWSVHRTINSSFNSARTERSIHRVFTKLGRNVTVQGIPESELFYLSKREASGMLKFFMPEAVAARMEARRNS